MIFFDATSFDKITKDRSDSAMDKLSAIGGTMGLLTGFSIISGVEIVYFGVKIILSLISRRKHYNPRKWLLDPTVIDSSLCWCGKTTSQKMLFCQMKLSWQLPCAWVVRSQNIIMISVFNNLSLSFNYSCLIDSYVVVRSPNILSVILDV